MSSLKLFFTRIAFYVLISAGVLVPVFAQAATLTSQQVQSTVSLLQSFGTDQTTINKVVVDLASAVVTSTSTVASSSLRVSTDASSPSYAVVAGGTSGVTMGVFNVTPTGEGVSLNKIGLTLASGKSGDVTTVYLYSGTHLLGTAVFTGNSTTATSTLTSSVSIGSGMSLQVTVKADISAIGVGQAGVAGDLVQVNIANVQATGLNTGTTINAGAQTSSAGVRIFKTYPIVTQLSDPTGVLSVGKQPILLRFSVTASPNGPVGVAAMSAKMVAAGVTFSKVAAYGFTDSAYSQPISNTASAGGNLGVINASSGYTGSFNMALNNGTAPFEIPAGATYYFEFVGDVSNISGNASVTTTLYGDSTYLFGASSIAAGSNFVWSPNDNGTSQEPGNDWTNGYGIMALPASGFTQTLTGSNTPVINTIPTTTPVISPKSITIDKTTYAPGSTITVSWNNQGTTHPKDWISLVTSGGAYGTVAGGQNVAWAFTGGAHAGSMTLPAPSHTGKYQLVYYVNNQVQELIRTSTFTVTAPVKVSLLDNYSDMVATVIMQPANTVASNVASLIAWPFLTATDSLSEIYFELGYQ